MTWRALSISPYMLEAGGLSIEDVAAMAEELRA